MLIGGFLYKKQLAMHWNAYFLFKLYIKGSKVVLYNDGLNRIWVIVCNGLLAVH